MTNTSKPDWLADAILKAQKNNMKMGIHEAIEHIPEEYHTVDFYKRLIEDNPFIVSNLHQKIMEEALHNLFQSGWIPENVGFPLKEGCLSPSAIHLLKFGKSVAKSNPLKVIMDSYMRFLGPEYFVTSCANDDHHRLAFKSAFGAQLAAELCQPPPSLLEQWLQEDLGL
jgi:hypothetical protein